MKKDLAIIFGLVFLVIVLLIFGQGFSTPGFLRSGSLSTPSAQLDTGLVNLKIKTLDIQAQLSNTPADRKKGLSKYESFPLNRGMIFVFEEKGPYAIWMKDMKFAIDIIWIDENKKIVDIVTNAPPEPGKKDEELTVYKPRGEAKYILEINAGLVDLHEIQIGDEVKF